MKVNFATFLIIHYPISQANIRIGVGFSYVEL